MPSSATAICTPASTLLLRRACQTWVAWDGFYLFLFVCLPGFYQFLPCFLLVFLLGFYCFFFFCVSKVYNLVFLGIGHVQLKNILV